MEKFPIRLEQNYLYLIYEKHVTFGFKKYTREGG